MIDIYSIFWKFLELKIILRNERSSYKLWISFSNDHTFDWLLSNASNLNDFVVCILVGIHIAMSRVLNPLLSYCLIILLQQNFLFQVDVGLDMEKLILDIVCRNKNHEPGCDSVPMAYRINKLGIIFHLMLKRFKFWIPIE